MSDALIDYNLETMALLTVSRHKQSSVCVCMCVCVRAYASMCLKQKWT